LLAKEGANQKIFKMDLEWKNPAYINILPEIYVQYEDL